MEQTKYLINIGINIDVSDSDDPTHEYFHEGIMNITDFKEMVVEEKLAGDGDSKSEYEVGRFIKFCGLRSRFNPQRNYRLVCVILPNGYIEDDGSNITQSMLKLFYAKGDIIRGD